MPLTRLPWELFVLCGTVVSVFAIYMEYRSKGVGLLFGGRKRKERDALQSQMQAMQGNLGDLREMMADMILTLDKRERLEGSEARKLPPST